MNPFTSAIVRGVIEDGDLERNISRLIEVYGQRMKVMEAALRRRLPQAEFATPRGGYFFWVRLPNIDTPDMRAHASAHHVDFRPGNLFSSAGASRDHMRLGVSFYDTQDLEKGIERLAELVGEAS